MIATPPPPDDARPSAFSSAAQGALVDLVGLNFSAPLIDLTCAQPAITLSLPPRLPLAPSRVKEEGGSSAGGVVEASRRPGVYEMSDEELRAALDVVRGEEGFPELVRRVAGVVGWGGGQGQGGGRSR